MENIETLEEIIKTRRTVKATKMNGMHIPHEQVMRLLDLAGRAPNHGKTEPWRFWVYEGEALNRFGENHAEWYWQHTPENKRKEAKAEKLKKYAQGASHLIVAVMKRTEKTKIPRFEEMAAVSAAIEHILLGATAMGLASFWNTGGMTRHQVLKDYLKLKEEDMVMGLLYLGYSDKRKPQKERKISLKDKIYWMD